MIPTPPYIRWSFQDVDEQNRAIIHYRELQRDLAEQGVVLVEGLIVRLWEVDEDPDGNPALMVEDGVVSFNASLGYWVATHDPTSFRFEAFSEYPWRTG